VQQNSRAAATEKARQTCYTARPQVEQRDIATAVPNWAQELPINGAFGIEVNQHIN